MKRVFGVIILLSIICINTISFANTLNINVQAEKQSVKIGEEVKINVNWNQKMQAADFVLRYDNQKVKFTGVDLSNDFYTDNNGAIKICWASFDNSEKSDISFTFEAIEEGDAEFKVNVDGGFADGNLIVPDNYNEGSSVVIIKDNNYASIFFVIGIIIFILIILIVFCVTDRKKRRTRNE